MPSPATASYGASKAAVLVSQPTTLWFS
jgi:hypothetical protein